MLGRCADPRVQAEFRAAQVELVTPVGVTAGDLSRELAAARRRVVDALGGEVRLIAAGTHPTSFAAPRRSPTGRGTG